MSPASRRSTKNKPAPHRSQKQAASPSRAAGWLQRLPALAGPAFWVMVLAVLAVRFWKLESLQAEVFGDISTATIYVRDVVSGRWPFYIPLSTGPLFHYLAAPAALVMGLTYYSLKVSSVLISLGALAFTYALARRLINSTFATLATFIAGISYWLLIHSRLGNVPIVVPLLAAALAWLLVCYIQQPENRWLRWAAVVSILGLYTYPGAYMLPAALLLAMLILHFSGPRVPAADWLRVIALLILLALPYAWIVSQNAVAFTSEGYLGGKFVLSAEGIGQLAQNALKAFAAYNIRGDSISRVNIAYRPHLDAVSGVLFLLGMWFWLHQPRRREGLILLGMFALMHVPSMLVISNNHEVPSATRTVGAAPLAYVFVASGIWQLAAWLRTRASHAVTVAACLGLVLFITLLNLVGYFGAYINGLPYQNTPIARHITDYANLLPENTQVYLVSCCWESGMPEPISIQDEMDQPENFHHIQADELSCSALDATLQGPAVIVWSYREPLPAPQLEACAERFPAQQFTSRSNLPLFHAAPVQGLRVVQPSAGLEAQWVQWNEQAVLVYYSALDSGRIEDVLDGNFDSLMRGAGDNPLVLEFEFDAPAQVQTLDISLAGLREFEVLLVLTYPDGSTHDIHESYSEMPSDPTVTLALPSTEAGVSNLHIEIKDLAPEPANGYHIHVRDVVLE
ncbi:MAG TPA: glycosyltransferase family 39 protein [Anaerolineales bacterium]|nr:glycosyltransferase family 39 protein [Anaerolineales bacterium]HRQ92956.1 glycosyltransferase family 39 protein [Anaerolineales bacterium]